MPVPSRDFPPAPGQENSLRVRSHVVLGGVLGALQTTKDSSMVLYFSGVQARETSSIISELSDP